MAKSSKRRGRKRRSAGPRSARESRAQVEVERLAGVDEERPPAPWGSLPLVEILVLAGIAFLIWGALSQNPVTVVVGLGLASLGGLELSVREHFSGYRSHSVLLAGLVAVLVIALSFQFTGLILLFCLAIGVVAFGVALYALRRAFRRASGGYNFRIGGLKG